MVLKKHILRMFPPWSWGLFALAVAMLAWSLYLAATADQIEDRPGLAAETLALPDHGYHTAPGPAAGVVENEPAAPLLQRARLEDSGYQSGGARQLFWLGLATSAFALLFLGLLCSHQYQRDQRLQAQKKLERVGAILNQAGEAIFVIDATSGTIIDANRSAARMLGCSRETLLHSHIRQFDAELAALPDDGWRDLLAKIEHAGEALLCERRLRRENGESFFVEVSAAHKVFERQGYVLLVVRDISERKQAESARVRLETQLHEAQKMETIGTLAGGIAHDFNNIISAILGYTDLVLQQTPPASEQAENLQEVVKAATYAKGVVQQILTYSRRTEQEPVPLLIHGIVKDAVKLVRASLPATVELREQLEANGELILADPTQIHQVLMNLCTNAYQALSDRRGRIEVRLTIEDAAGVPNPPANAGRYVKLTVRDNGCGMDAATQQRIFDPFFTTKAVGEGTGLGLSVVQGIIMRLGGTIDVDSAPGQGAIFTVMLPVHEGDPSPKNGQLPEATLALLAPAPAQQEAGEPVPGGVAGESFAAS